MPFTIGRAVRVFASWGHLRGGKQASREPSGSRSPALSLRRFTQLPAMRLTATKHTGKRAGRTAWSQKALHAHETRLQGERAETAQREKEGLAAMRLHAWREGGPPEACVVVLLRHLVLRQPTPPSSGQRVFNLRHSLGYCRLAQQRPPELVGAVKAEGTKLKNGRKRWGGSCISGGADPRVELTWAPDR
jgi:hypothetical protein